ncbi:MULTISPECIES: hypothetical protein [unclassified Streptomyces]|uniref:hypothetical protein n=1 Tax=unclassified Streptomyces TaxID=2593676 RepID=UPI0007DD254C|nr:hypothetical protein A8713_30840 [Streptomyces sp. SAT1]
MGRPRALFAASGEGVRPRPGTDKGLLLQRYALRSGGAGHAVSAYSGDHGVTWLTVAPPAPC